MECSKNDICHNYDACWNDIRKLCKSDLDEMGNLKRLCAAQSFLDVFFEVKAQISNCKNTGDTLA